MSEIQEDTDGFLTPQQFYNGGSAKKRARRTIDSASSVPPKTVTSLATQTDPPQPSAFRCVKSRGPAQVRNEETGQKLHAYEIVHALNDSRPEIDERFTLTILLQSVPEFHPSETVSFDRSAERKKDAQDEAGKVGRIPKRVVKNVLKNMFQNVVDEAYPSHLIAQEALDLFLTTSGPAAQEGDASQIRFSFLLGVLIPVLGSHLRRYVGFLHNLSALHNESLSKSSLLSESADFSLSDPKSSLTSYFLTVMRSASMATIHHIETIEKNVKLALVVLTKLLEMCPSLLRFFLRDFPVVDDGRIKLDGETEGADPVPSSSQGEPVGPRCKDCFISVQ